MKSHQRLKDNGMKLSTKSLTKILPCRDFRFVLKTYAAQGHIFPWAVVE